LDKAKKALLYFIDITWLYKHPL